MKMDRFQPETRADEMVECIACNQRFHYSAIDSDTGFCGQCLQWAVERDEILRTTQTQTKIVGGGK